ncbi:DNA polymerase III subunit epsilon [Limibaculum sp. M0105]|uniref:DNA polymerase III subunit epsilon n=1 Tax=Thermohalobaculum xanthum TaxID=2753746 RepID=A0A8J7SIT2_9RHOB|nr:DNA polymerase III subunit epsilon [Thermohalobaculum xanthum]MBK0400520.1 DNA polymerase III subunit epsilon [Thermohalobaculum xanthum]
MREIVLDTETTGLEPSQGHRIVEIGAVELFNLLPTGRTYHQYINPEMPMPPDAFRIHGLGDDFLADKPVFRRIARGFLDFVGDARLVIHNASFDMAMINAELRRLGADELPMSRALDTVQIARQRFPGAPANLDALCKRFGVDNSAREKHGALLDCELLAEVYLELMGGRQTGFALNVADQKSEQKVAVAAPGATAAQRPRPLAPRLSDAEAAAHDAFLAELGENAMWLKMRSDG